MMEQKENFLIETNVSEVSVAVRLINDYTDENPTSKIELYLKDQMGRERKPVRNAGGYYIFFNLPKDSYTILVKGGECYFDKMEDVSSSELGIQRPVVKNISLTPSPSYSFSANATLIRGCLLDSQRKGISKAVIGVKGKKDVFQTTENGEFAVYFRGLEEYEVKKVDGKMMVKINGENPILEIKHPDFENMTKSVEVEERKTVSLSITFGLMRLKQEINSIKPSNG
jgi:hypothetical protein